MQEHAYCALHVGHCGVLSNIQFFWFKRRVSPAGNYKTTCCYNCHSIESKGTDQIRGTCSWDGSALLPLLCVPMIIHRVKQDSNCGSERLFRSRSSYLKSIIVIHGMPARPAAASEGGLQPHNIWWSGISYRLSMHGTVLPLISLCYTTALSECWAVSRSYWQSNKIIQIDHRTRIMASDWLR